MHGVAESVAAHGFAVDVEDSGVIDTATEVCKALGRGPPPRTIAEEERPWAAAAVPLAAYVVEVAPAMSVADLATWYELSWAL